MRDVEFVAGPMFYRDSCGDSRIGTLRLRWNTGNEPGHGVISRKLSIGLYLRPTCLTVGVVWNGSRLDSIVQVFLLPCVAIRIHLVSSHGGYFASQRRKVTP
jgi:hypothetical protein